MCRRKVVCPNVHSSHVETIQHTLDSGQGMSLEKVVLHLEKELAEAKERLLRLEDDNKALRSSAAHYRANWINECRMTDARHASHPSEDDQDDKPCISQAGWFSSSPDRTYGQCRLLK